MAAIDGHRAADGPLARRLPPGPLGEQSAHAEAPGARVLLLRVQDLSKERQRELVGRVRRRARPLVFQPSEPVARERL